MSAVRRWLAGRLDVAVTVARPAVVVSILIAAVALRDRVGRRRRHRRCRCLDRHRRRRRRRGLMCPERWLAYALPAIQRRVDVHDDPVPAARLVGERVPAGGTGPGGLRLDATRVMSGHDDPGMRCRPDPHPNQRPGDSMPAGVHAAPERRRWCRGGGGRRGDCRVYGWAGGRSRAAACGSGQARGAVGSFRSCPARIWDSTATCEFSGLGGVRVFIDQTRFRE